MDTDPQSPVAALILKIEAVGFRRNGGIHFKDYAVSKPISPLYKLLTDGYRHSVVSVKLFTVVQLLRH